MPARIAIGQDDFARLRREGSEFVDKTHMIQTLLNDHSIVTLLPRPRRFGKTLNMSMLDAFLAKRPQNYSSLFEGLSIWNAGDQYRAHFQRYPTIFLSFKNIKPDSLEQWEKGIRLELGAQFRRCIEQYPLLESSLSPVEKRSLQDLADHTADFTLMARSLHLMSEWLERAYGEKVLLLIDEYDTPIQSAWLATPDMQLPPEALKKTLYGQVITFFQTLFGSAMKGNPALFKAVLTGILRVSKESIFSDLNNIKVRTILESEYADCFGFTEQEVVALFERQHQSSRLDEARQWYNGYRFGPHTIYNPWSVINYLAQPDAPAQAYWLNTSSNDLIRELLQQQTLTIAQDLQTLMEGGAIVREVDSNTAFMEIRTSSNAMFSLLLFTGYLTAQFNEWNALEGIALYSLRAPNLEVRRIYRATFVQWLTVQLDGTSERLKKLEQAILTGDEETLEYLLEYFCRNMVSLHDTVHEPEAFYQGLMLGLCAVLEPAYRVLSNRESGMGRADLLIIPRPSIQPGQLNRPGAVLELKVARRKRKTLKQALAEGLEQLKEKQYLTELQAAGVTVIHTWVLAFDGKKVMVKYGGKG